MVEILTKTLISWEQFTSLLRTEVSCSSDLVQHPNPHSFAADLLEGERSNVPLVAVFVLPDMAQMPEFLNLVSHRSQYPHSYLQRHQCMWNMSSSSDSPSVLHTFPVCTIKSGETTEDLTRQLMLVAWFRWWWPLVTSRPQPARGFRAAGADFFAACCTQPWHGLMQLAVPKGTVTALWFLILHSFCQFFHWFNTCDGDIRLEVSSLPQKHMLTSALRCDWCTSLVLV